MRSEEGAARSDRDASEGSRPLMAEDGRKAGERAAGDEAETTRRKVDEEERKEWGPAERLSRSRCNQGLGRSGASFIHALDRASQRWSRLATTNDVPTTVARTLALGGAGTGSRLCGRPLIFSLLAARPPLAQCLLAASMRRASVGLGPHAGARLEGPEPRGPKGSVPNFRSGMASHTMVNKGLPASPQHLQCPRETPSASAHR